jgi:hypothetical protein
MNGQNRSNYELRNGKLRPAPHHFVSEGRALSKCPRWDKVKKSQLLKAKCLPCCPNLFPLSHRFFVPRLSQPCPRPFWDREIIDSKRLIGFCTALFAYFLKQFFKDQNGPASQFSQEHRREILTQFARIVKIFIYETSLPVMMNRRSLTFIFVHQPRTREVSPQ